ncbi:MAG: hypothetical protein HZB31_15375 [Nitrospirae bacterium]|nr:hypothetical protein [Nitrospirota bacterium]
MNELIFPQMTPVSAKVLILLPIFFLIGFGLAYVIDKANKGPKFGLKLYLGSGFLVMAALFMAMEDFIKIKHYVVINRAVEFVSDGLFLLFCGFVAFITIFFAQSTKK